MSKVALHIGNDIYSGWQKVKIDRSIETISGGFELSVTDKWAADMAARQLYPGQPVKIGIDDETVITGRLDDVDISYASDAHELTLRGRDATAQLVDCAADHGQTAFDNQSLTQICKVLCKPFGVDVIAATDVGDKFKKINVQPGEAVFDIIDRLCRNRAVMPISDGLGNLVLTRAGTVKSGRLALGENNLTGNINRSWKERYSAYLVKGQGQAASLLQTKAHTQTKAQAFDPAYKDIYRPFTILAETQGDTAKFTERARFEANRRAGQSEKANYTAFGWRIKGDKGALWQPNTLVQVDDGYARISGDRLVVSTSFQIGDEGTTTAITVAPAAAYDRLALPEDITGGGLFG